MTSISFFAPWRNDETKKKYGEKSFHHIFFLLTTEDFQQQKRIKMAKESLTFHPRGDSFFMLGSFFTLEWLTCPRTCKPPPPSSPKTRWIGCTLQQLILNSVQFWVPGWTAPSTDQEGWAFPFCLSWSLEQKSTHRMFKWKIIQRTKFERCAER